MTEQAVDKALADELVGNSPYIRRVREQVRQLADCDVPLLLQGETGTGKETVARAVYRLSNRGAAPFVVVNCAAGDDAMLEVELFGRAEGAGAGANCAMLGVLRAGDGGTCFLKEIGCLSESLQTRLLSFLDQRAVTSVGGASAVAIDVRIICSTRAGLGRAVRGGEFRRDLYDRLNAVCLLLSPLREHPGDIPALAEHMLKRIAAALQVPVKKLSSPAEKVMLRYDWPGNVRHLGSVIQRAYVLGAGPIINVEQLPAELSGATAGPG